MAQSDSIADLLTRLRNAVQARHRFVDIRLTRMKLEILKVLEKQGFVEHILVDDADKKMRVFLKYDKDREPLLQGLKRMSRPGRRKYIGATEIPKIFNGMGMVILSTSQGIVDGSAALKQKVGGEFICYVW